ncbi:MAG: cytochrome c biogenesis CcdA family protein [Longimicrobiales bacterium]
METSVSLSVAILAGILSFLSPCVLPLVPSYLGFVTGMSIDELNQGRQRRSTLLHALLFVSGFSTIFLLLGASASFLGQLLLNFQDWISRVGGILIILLGLHLLGAFRFAPLLRERRLHLANRPVGYLGAFAVGVVFAAGWTPCIGPVLGAVLTYASIQETMGSGVLLLGAYAFGLALPFLAAAAATGTFLDASQRVRRHLPLFERASGLILVIAGLLLASGSFPALSGYFARLTPEFLLERL